MIPENIEPKTVGVQRNPTEKINSRNGRAKILSRYLGASLGSCHDYCKYGRKHGFETKERIPIRKWIKVRQGKGQDLKMDVSSADRKINFVIGLTPDQDSETKNHDELDANKKQVSSASKKESASSVSEEDLSALEGIVVSVEEDPDGSSLKLEQSKPSSLPRQANVETKKGKESQESSSRRKTSTTRSKEMRKLVLGERKVLGPPSVPLSTKRSLRRVSDITTRNSKNVKRESHLKSQNKVKKSVKPEHTSYEDVPEKTLYVIESTLENRTLEPTQDDAHSTELSQSSTSTAHLPPSSQKKSRSTRSGPHASRSLPSPLLGKKGIGHRRHEAQSIKPPLASLQSLTSSTSPSECLDGKENGLDGTTLQQTEVIEKEKKKTVNSKVNQKKMVSAKVEHRNSARRGGILVKERNSPAAQKLKFKRGTILDLKAEDNTPRRLKFRRVKFLREIQNGKKDIKKASVKSNEAAVDESAESGTKTKQDEKTVLRNQNADGISTTARRSLRRKGTSEGDVIGTKTSPEKFISRHQNMEVATRRSLRRREIIRGELSGGTSKTNSERVVLRHQNVTSKKEVRSLLNNVIEETASKLVVTRKSKVKALVGAFETVISLQDAKPAVAAGAS